MSDAPMTPAVIAEVLQRFIDAQRRGERVSDCTLDLADEAVAELLRPLSMEEAAECAAFGSYIGERTLTALGKVNGESN
jgi:hypothetical protein